MLYDAETPRLYLQRLDGDDPVQLEAFHRLQTNERCMAWSRSEPHTNIEQTLELMLGSKPSPETPWKKRYGIFLKPGVSPKTANGDVPAKERMMGVIGFPREQEVGYKSLPEFWGNGYMTEALNAFIELFFRLPENAKYAELKAAADPENIASNRLLQKVGFVKAEYWKEFYERPFLNRNGEGRKSDLQTYVLKRPGMEGV